MNYSNYEIKLNNVENAESLVTFNHIPTILSLEPTTSGGTKSYLALRLQGGTLSKNVEYFIQINDTKIYATNDINKVANNTFYIPNINSVESNMGMAYYFCRALNNTKLANTFNIYIDKQTDYSGNKVKIEGKEFGYNVKLTSTNIPSNIINIADIPVTTSNANDTLVGSKIIVDVYGEDTTNDTSISDFGRDLPFIAQLEKNYYKDGIAFDIAPLLINHTNDGNLCEYNLVVSAIGKDGTMSRLGEIRHNYALNGYSFANGLKYLDMGELASNCILQNVKNGAETGLLNRTELYYIDAISFSMLFYEATNRFTLTAIYRDSALNEIGRETTTRFFDGTYLTVDIAPSNLDAYYCDINIPDLGVLRYTNIKPLKYGDSKHYKNIYFYNSYGGVSFCPFTASEEEEYDKKTITFTPHHFDYYITDKYSYEKTYSNDVETTVTLKSHYISEDGIYTYKDLLNSYNVWIYDKDNNKIEISIEDISFEEVQHHIFQCTCKYKVKEF